MGSVGTAERPSRDSVAWPFALAPRIKDVTGEGPQG